MQESQQAIANEKGYQTVEQFFNEKQYAQSHILIYEKIFGKDYVSVGGKVTTEVKKSCDKFCINIFFNKF